ncbi:hypothetical protein CFB82_31445 [Burkholderia sp. HI2714]|nr:hypothetical protein CFB82_31445 [Burkholderia sp. HI2714]
MCGQLFRRIGVGARRRLGHGCLLCSVPGRLPRAGRPNRMALGRTLEPGREARQHLDRHPY